MQRKRCFVNHGMELNIAILSFIFLSFPVWFLALNFISITVPLLDLQSGWDDLSQFQSVRSDGHRIWIRTDYGNLWMWESTLLRLEVKVKLTILMHQFFTFFDSFWFNEVWIQFLNYLLNQSPIKTRVIDLSK